MVKPISYNFTLGRALDKNYLPNRLIISITTIAFIAGIVIHLFRENNLLDAVVFGVVLALIVFLSWALAREIYPQGEYAALAGAVLCVVSLTWFGIFPIIILILLWFTISLRLINQTTGLKSSNFDRVIILIFTIISAYLFSWVFLVFLVIIFAVNYRLTKENSDIIFIIIGMVAAFVFIFFQRIGYNQGSLTYINGLFVGVLLLIFAVMMWLGRNIHVFGDQSQKKVPANRIFSAQIMSIVFFGGYVIWFGDKSLFMLIPMWCVLICAIIFSIMQLLKNFKKIF